MKKPYTCPVCNGTTNVPGGFYNSNGLGISSSTNVFDKCRSCKNGIIVIDDKDESITKPEKQKTLFDIHNEVKTNHVFSDFKIGTYVEVVTPSQDFHFFYNEKGKVIINSHKYLGIIVEFDKPREFEDGTIQTKFNFNPEDLKIIEEVK